MSKIDKLGTEFGSAKTLVIDFRKLLTLDPDPQKQTSLRRILIEEIDKLAGSREQLETAARLTARGSELIAKGRAHLERQDRSDAALGEPDYRRTLELMETIEQLFENFQRRLRTNYPYSVKIRDEVVRVCASLDEAEQCAQQFAEANPDAAVTVVSTASNRRVSSSDRQ